MNQNLLNTLIELPLKKLSQNTFQKLGCSEDSIRNPKKKLSQRHI
jgi:hypothetical protein